MYYNFKTVYYNQEWRNEMEKEENVYFLGRLAEYTYYNMDAVVYSALNLFEKIKRKVL